MMVRSHNQSDVDDANAEPAAAAEQSLSIGGYVAHQRQLRGVSLEELSDLTRIPLRSLERLESGQFDHDIDGFVRGFVRTVADALGLDPDDTVARMLVEPSGSDRAVYTGGLPVRPILASLAAMLVLLGALLLGRALVGREPSPVASGNEVDQMIRVDAVRALAEAAEAAEPASSRAPEDELPTGAGSDGTLPAVGTAPPGTED